MADASLRVLGPGDEAALKAFLAPRADSSLFLISNLAQAGIVNRDVPYAGVYVGRFDEGALTGVVAHYWNGTLVLQCERDALVLAALAMETSKRRLRELAGPWSQVSALRASPSFAARAATTESRERLYAVALEDLAVPAALASGAVTCRRATERDLDLAARWRAGFRQELMNETPGPDLDASAREAMMRTIGAGASFLLEEGGAPVAHAAFNAQTPDIVQIGGVWTPPELRGRGYARCVVAGQLVIARAQGAKRAVLFTGEENHAAQRAYEAIGFKQIGAYGLILFD